MRNLYISHIYKSLNWGIDCSLNYISYCNSEGHRFKYIILPRAWFKLAQYLFQFSLCSLPWKKDLSREEIHVVSVCVPTTNCDRNEWPDFNYPICYLQCANLVCHFSFYHGFLLDRYFPATYLLITAWMRINGVVIKSEGSTLERLCHRTQNFNSGNRNVLSFNIRSGNRKGHDQSISQN